MPSDSIQALDIKVEGVVQGVGFRPFVYREATSRGLRGWVLNAIDGVTIHAEGPERDIDGLVIAISENAPAAAQVRAISLDEARLEGFKDFQIRFSDDADAEETTLVSPDLATCDECVAELFDPADRRYRYPFINCTNCGPRFTIMRELPYDRPNTSMEPFEMCPSCAAEYGDPADRRFHAQPDACFECGPHLGWIAAGEKQLDVADIEWAHDRLSSDGLLDRAVGVLLDGGIVAVKGLGGYHLACDASNAEAVARLRERKHREGKALAIMVADVQGAEAICSVDAAERAQLEHPARPIVLLNKRADVTYTPALADALPEVGIMLPATPVQHLLVHDFAAAYEANGNLNNVPALVMTSGNMHDEPIVTTEQGALSRLAGVADGFLVNDREILSRYDDSVVRVLDGASAGPIVQVIRRARGLAPMPVKLPLPEGLEGDMLEVFAAGPEQKCTFALTRGDKAFVSQHIGDMEDAATYDSWLATKGLYEKLFHLQPQLVAHDKHPEYLTSKWASAQKLDTMAFQHHHAHIVAAMAEHGLEGPVCGFAFDGTGYGVDGAIWGGEVMLSNLMAFERFANVTYFPLPGGGAAIKNPERVAYGALWSFDLLEHPAAQAFLANMEGNATLLGEMIEKGLNTPYTSSMGRLFDAASVLSGCCTKPKYEGEAAILFEAALHELALRDPAAVKNAGAYQFSIIKNIATDSSTAEDTSVLLIDPAPVFEALLDDLAADVPAGVVSVRFHNGVVALLVQMAEIVRAIYDIRTVVLAGGVFMNRYLIEHALSSFQDAGFTVALNRELPPNDASISFGQAVLALHSKNKE